jgi:hypothetical protein
MTRLSSVVAVKMVSPREPRRLRTTLGDLIAAACDATGNQPGRAAELIERGPLSNLLNRRVKFE